MSDWIKVYKDNKTVKEIDTWIMIKDPMVARESGIGLTKVVVKGETIVGVGPTSSRIAVVDYDMTYDKVIEGAELTSGANPNFKTSFNIEKLRDGDEKKPHKKSVYGVSFNGNTVFDLQDHEVDKLESDLHFHQVNVWATIQKTMDLLEQPDILGRRIPWAFNEGRIKILPHACYDENAYYDRSTGSICFGYFYNTSEEAREKNEKKLVFTCLSHDVVTHELGHAILDGLKPYYSECSSAATAGFHEYFGDAVALTTLLANHAIVVQVAGRDDSLLNSANPIANIAQELGQSVGISEVGIRSAQNRRKIGHLTQSEINEEHDYSEILSGAYYDLLELVYKHHVKLRKQEKKKHGKGKINGGDRANALFQAAAITRRMMLRALDYCPPVDLDYLDYARAVYRADQTAHPLEPNIYREMWVKVCLNRQICRSRKHLQLHTLIANDELRGLNLEKLSSSRTDAYDFIDANREKLNLPNTANINVINLYRTNKTASQDYRVPQEVIVEFVWVSEVQLLGRGYGELENSFVNLWCGGTLVFSRDGNLLHYTVKNEEKSRAASLLKYTKFLCKAGYLGVDGVEKGLGSAMTKKVTARVVDGKVSLTRNASMRCRRKKPEGKKNG